MLPYADRRLHLGDAPSNGDVQITGYVTENGGFKGMG